MKRLILALVLSVGTVLGVQAQSQSVAQFGIKGALNFSKLKSDDDRILSSANKTGYQVGIWTRFGGAVHVQPELYLTGKSSNADYLEDNGSGNLKADVTFTSLDLPVLIGSRVGVGPLAIRFQAGPLVSFVVDKKIGDALQEVTNFNNYKNNSFSVVGGVGLDIGKIRTDLRYEHALSNLTKDEAGVADQRINVWTLGIGLRLF